MFTWCKNKEEIPQYIENFLLEYTSIAGEFNIKSQVLFTFGNRITCEIPRLNPDTLDIWRQRLNHIEGLECVQEGEFLKLILWIAFPAEDIAHCQIKNEPQSNEELSLECRAS